MRHRPKGSVLPTKPRIQTSSCVVYYYGELYDCLLRHVWCTGSRRLRCQSTCPPCLTLCFTMYTPGGAMHICFRHALFWGWAGLSAACIGTRVPQPPNVSDRRTETALKPLERTLTPTPINLFNPNSLPVNVFTGN